MTEEEEEIQEEQPEKADSSELIEAANKAADRLEAGNKELKKLLEQQQKVIVEKTFGGEAEAGVKRKTKEQKAQEAAEKMLAGTGMAEYAFPNAKTDSSYN